LAAAGDPRISLRSMRATCYAVPDGRATKGGKAMPFVRIDLLQGKPQGYRKELGEIVYEAMRETLNVPPDDKFQVITEHPADGFNITESYLGNRYSGDIVLIQVAECRAHGRAETGVLPARRRRHGRAARRPQGRRRHQPDRGQQGLLVVRRRGGAIRDVRIEGRPCSPHGAKRNVGTDKAWRARPGFRCAPSGLRLLRSSRATCCQSC
jgi:Tautomerase enzyme